MKRRIVPKDGTPYRRNGKVVGLLRQKLPTSGRGAEVLDLGRTAIGLAKEEMALSLAYHLVYSAFSSTGPSSQGVAFLTLGSRFTNSELRRYQYIDSRHSTPSTHCRVESISGSIIFEKVESERTRS